MRFTVFDVRGCTRTENGGPDGGGGTIVFKLIFKYLISIPRTIVERFPVDTGRANISTDLFFLSRSGRRFLRKRTKPLRTCGRFRSVFFNNDVPPLA